MGSYLPQRGGGGFSCPPAGPLAMCAVELRSGVHLKLGFPSLHCLLRVRVPFGIQFYLGCTTEGWGRGQQGQHWLSPASAARPALHVLRVSQVRGSPGSALRPGECVAEPCSMPLSGLRAQGPGLGH